MQNQADDGAILNWLTPVEYGPQQSDYLDRRQPGTGQWLLDSAEYHGWLNTERQTLFCTGNPGAGKTIITALVIEDLITRFPSNPTIGITFLYCNFRLRDQQTAEDLLAALLKQLSRGCSVLPDIVKILYGKHRAKETRPSITELSKALHTVAALYSRVFVIVDAVDECQESNGCQKKILAEILDLETQLSANVFVTSRPIPEIAKVFMDKIRLNITARDDDVQRYLDGRLSQVSGFLRRDRQLQEEIKTEIVQAVDGM